MVSQVEAFQNYKIAVRGCGILLHLIEVCEPSIKPTRLGSEVRVLVPPQWLLPESERAERVSK